MIGIGDFLELGVGMGVDRSSERFLRLLLISRSFSDLVEWLDMRVVG